MSTVAAQTLPPRPAVMGPYRPDWLEKPTSEDMSTYYPRHAARNDISGKATISCKVTSGGLLDQCRVIEESPLGEHFGKAALKLAPKFRMIPPDDPAAGPSTVVVPLIFKIPETRVMIRPDGPEDARLMMQIGCGFAAACALLLITLIWLLGCYHSQAAKRRAGRP